MQKELAVYLLSNKHRTVYYVGVTNNVEKRLIEHYQNACLNNKKTFTGRYQCFYCVAYENISGPINAIHRETEVKGWRREKKLAWAKTLNPDLHFLNDEILGRGWEETYRPVKPR